MSSLLQQPAPVLVYGHPSLRSIAKLLPAGYSLSVLKAHVETMWATLVGTSVGSAIAAPQIGLALRLFIIKKNISGFPPGIFSDDLAYGVFVNPYFTSVSGSVLINNDGCLSIPNYTHSGVERHAKFTLRFQTFGYQDGKPALVEATITDYVVNPTEYFGWVVQHEAEHLDGKFFVDQLPADPVLNNYKTGNYSVAYATLPAAKF